MTHPRADDPEGWLDPDAVATTAADLVTVPSTTGDEAAVLDHVAAWLVDAGVPSVRTEVPIDALRRHPRFSAEVARDVVPVLAARVGRDSGGRRLLVNAHVDVVAPGRDADWHTPPFVGTVVDGHLRGRGAADTKGGLAAAMHVLAHLAAAGRAGDHLPGEVVLTPVVGEEDGGAGTLATLLGSPPVAAAVDAAVVVEPTGLAVGVASAGALCFRVTVAGRRAHGSVRHRGVSAIDKGVAVLGAIRRFEAGRRDHGHPRLGRDDLPVCVGRVVGGDERCDEAAWLHLEGRVGVAPGESVDVVREAFAAAVRDVDDPWLAEHPPDVDWIGGQWLPAEVDADDPFARLVAEITGTPMAGLPYGCDLGLLQQVGGIPGVVLGPGDVATAHAPDEAVPVAELGTFARMLAGIARGWCGSSRA